MQKEHAIGITGAGIICAIGNNADEVRESLRNRVSGIAGMQYLQSKHSDLPVGEVKMTTEQMAEMLGLDTGEPLSRTSLMGSIAIRQALQQAGIKSLEGKRVAVVSGTTVGGMDVAEKFWPEYKAGNRPIELPVSNECGRSTMESVEYAGISGVQCCTISTACSSALNAIMTGSDMLLNDEADIVLAGGTEGLSVFHLNGFNTLMILDRERCRPFDATRAGLNLGEGAAFVVLEKDPDKAMAYVSGYGNRCDAYHQTATSEDGDGAFLAMTDAIVMAGLKPEDIDYVSAHGTGTPDNDSSESHALIRVFGRNMPPVSSTKAFTGHTTSASGSIETVICLLAMRDSFIPANLGWKHPIDGGIIPTLGADNVSLSHVLCNAFGFGGNDSSLVLSLGRSTLKASGAEYEVTTAAEVLVTSQDELSSLKEFISPMESRRMDALMKAALLSAFRALKESGIECPDAIISGTSHGMLETSHKFLNDIYEFGEETLKPTLFMQSTHNTIGSAIAIRTRCHGYNITYSQCDDSLRWAMRDATFRIRCGRSGTVLVGCYDESENGIYARTLILKRK